MHNDVEILFPVLGLHEGAAYKDQPPLTTPSCLNVVDRDPVTDRERGAQRPGLTKYNASQVSGSNAVVEGLSVTRIDGRVTYTAVESENPAQDPAIIDQAAMPSRLDVLDIVTDEQSNLYVASGTSGGGTGLNFVVKLNSGLQQQWLYALPLQRSTDVVKSIRLDDEGGVYAVITGSTSGPTLLIKLEETGLDFAPVREAWRLEAPNGGWWTCCDVKRGVMYAVEIVPDAGNVHVYLHRIDQIDAVNPVVTWSARIRTGAAGTCEECYAVAVADDGAAICAIVDPDNPPAANGKLEKFGPMQPDTGTPATDTSAGSLDVWTYSGEGVGQAIVVKDGFLYTQGYGATVMVRKLTDNGASVTSVASVAVDGATRFKGANSIAVDHNGNVYVTTDSAGTDTVVTKFSSALANLWEITGTDLGVNNMNAYAVAVDPKYADAGATAPIAEFLYVGTEAESSNYYSLHKLRLANVVTSVGSPRETFQICVANGNIRKVTASSVATPAGAPTLDATARWIMGVAGLNRVLFTDGRQYKSMDLLAGTDGTVSTWTPTAGEIPRRGRLLTIWQNCAMVAGFEENPNQWAMSAVGDFDNWDFFPADEGVGSAILGSDSRAGLCPDIITSLIPWTDDLLIVGGDKTIQRMTGHPRAEGRFDVVTDQCGMAWGRPACLGPSGEMYFISSQGAFCRLVPGDTPAEISLDPLSDRFRDLDVGAYRFRLAWDHKLKGVWIFVTPYSAGTATHYFWSARRGGFWPQQFAAAAGAHNPMAVWVMDGDAASDRGLLLGCADGYVRTLAEAAKDDDGTAIDSYVYMLVPAGKGDELRLNNWRAVMGNGVEDVTLSVFEMEQPDFNTLPSATFSATLSAGRNDAIHEPVRGNALLVRIRNNTTARRWSFESLVAARGYAGRARNR